MRLGLREVVTFGIACAQEGEVKSTVVESIAGYIENNYVNKEIVKQLGDISVHDAQSLFGMGIELGCHDGDVVSMRVLGGCV